MAQITRVALCGGAARLFVRAYTLGHREMADGGECSGSGTGFRDERAMLLGGLFGTCFYVDCGRRCDSAAVDCDAACVGGGTGRQRGGPISGRDGADGTGADAEWARWFDAENLQESARKRCSYLLACVVVLVAMTILLHRMLLGGRSIRFRRRLAGPLGTPLAAFRASLMYCCSGGSLGLSSRRRFLILTARLRFLAD